MWVDSASLGNHLLQQCWNGVQLFRQGASGNGSDVNGSLGRGVNQPLIFAADNICLLFLS